MTILLILLIASIQASAAPHAPASPSQVIERLASGPEQGDLSQIRRDQQELARRPRDLALAVALARRCVALGRSEAEPRFYGFAQAALAPWWGQARPPLDVLMLRAVIRQAGHDFQAALADLDELIRREPARAQAWLTRAVILQARGDFARAEGSCAGAARQGRSPDAGLVCLWSVRGLQGRAREALRMLEPAFVARSSMESGVRLWALGIAADLTRRLGEREKARRGYERALAYQPGEPFLLAAYSDLLLDMKQYEAIGPLLEPYRKNGNLLLRLALAERRLGRPSWKQSAIALDAYFGASRLRGDVRHLREEARFTLELQDDPARALALARQNWSIQREPEDLRVLIESALQARDRPTLELARDWRRRSRLEDVELERLLQ